jgi:tetratricopeptide (TPR) repeat protein
MLLAVLAVIGTVFEDDATRLVRESTEAADDERWDDVVALTTEAIELEPDDVDVLAHAYSIRSHGLTMLGRYDEAVADATAAVELAPSDDLLAMAHVRRHLIRTDMRWQPMAAAASLVIDDPASGADEVVRALADRAFAYSRMDANWLDAAVDDATAVLRLTDDASLRTQALITRSFASVRAGSADRGSDDADAAAALAPDRVLLARAYAHRAWVELELDRTAEAVANATAAVMLAPPAPIGAEAHLYLAVAQGRQGHFEAARTNADTGIGLSEDDDVLASLYRNRAAANLMLSEWDRAIEDATAAIELDTDAATHGYALQIRGTAYDEVGLDDLARQDLALGQAFVDLVE